VIARVVTLSTTPVISAEEFRVIFSLGGALSPVSTPLSAADTPGGTIQGAEKDAIVQALLTAEGNQTKAAKALGMGRNTLWRKMKKYGIDSHS